MSGKKALFLSCFFLFLGAFVFSYQMGSQIWGFTIDLPEDYIYSGGDGRDSFSFENPSGAKFDINVYSASRAFGSVEELALDVHKRLNNSGENDSFEYRGKKACLLELSFSLPGSALPGSGLQSGGLMSGWALCVELKPQDNSDKKPLLLALAYGPIGRNELTALHLSALDSLSPGEEDLRAPGPITEYAYPRLNRRLAPVFGLGINAWVFEEDAEAAQALIDREFQVLRFYAEGPKWKEAWLRFYRAVYRDSFERLVDIAFQTERKFNVPPRENRDFAEQLLFWVQSFKYERDLLGSDFINLVSAATEGRGDCDNRAMLWAVILAQANIPTGIMVSREYSHAMGLADLSGMGARLEVNGQKYLVAETTAKVSIGLIGETVSGIEYWLGIIFE